MRVEAIRKNDHFEVPDLDDFNLTQDKVTLTFDYEKYKNVEVTKKNHIPKSEPGSLQESLNNILGDYAKERVNVSIGEDRKLLMDAMWDKYGQ